MIQYFEEKFSERFQEMMELVQAHYDEVGNHEFCGDLDPDYERYLDLEEAGILQLLTARDEDGIMIGYSLEILTPHLHHRNVKYALNDIIYVVPKYRKSLVPITLLSFVQQALLAKGVKRHIITMMTGFEFKGLADRAGYELIESNYGKRLGE